VQLELANTLDVRLTPVHLKFGPARQGQETLSADPSTATERPTNVYGGVHTRLDRLKHYMT
ncbi:hypothetical protein LB507_002899, partial [Fusarium sp. FIESC RH6]